ncbi:MAG: Coenzyme F420 hydrogenase/dehydrogenase, beta subunit C-terminal domain [Microcystaceae cyanobacterium]
MSLDKLLTNVVNGGYCVGCGACASVEGSPLQMKLDDYGKLQATLDSSANDNPDVNVSSVCPFSGESENEDQIAKTLFADNAKHHAKIGYYLANYAGYVSEGDFRNHGSSGGMGTWILTQLLKQNLVDYVIHIQPRQPTDEDSRLFHYQISTSIEEVQRGSKSRYYPIEMSEVMHTIRQQEGRYAVVGIPCFIRAIRLLTNQDDLLAERIKFSVGLVCGHLKSKRFAEMFAWECGIEPRNVLAFNFRKKILGKKASQYAIEVKGIKNGETVTKSRLVGQLFGSDWGLGFLKYKACDYCDDVVAETADITIGDAWLPQYVDDSLGTNIVIVRNPKLLELVSQARQQGELNLDVIDAATVVQSQKSGFNHRREGLAYRLYMAQRQGKWYPPKRMLAKSYWFNPLFRRKHEMRVKMAETSHIAFQKALEEGQFMTFKQQMRPLIQQYRTIYQPLRWLVRSLKRKFKK